MRKCFYIVAFLASFLCTDLFAQQECVADSASVSIRNRFAARPLATDDVFGDLNGDREVDVADIVTIINIMKGDYDPKTMQIVNRSSKTLYSFTIFFGDINGNVMSSEERGDLYPGDKTTVKVPVGAYKFYMTYYNKNLGTWLYSPIYSVGSKTFTLTEFDISQWTTD